MYYDKQIRYIDYLENGEKQRNCGYVKMTVTGERLLLEMRIKGLYETDDVASEVILEGAGAEKCIGIVQIRQGSGSFEWEVRDLRNEGEALVIGNGLRYGQLERVQVQLSPRRSLRCVWRDTIPQAPGARYTKETNWPEQAANQPEGTKNQPEKTADWPEGTTSRQGRADWPEGMANQPERMSDWPEGMPNQPEKTADWPEGTTSRQGRADWSEGMTNRPERRADWSEETTSSPGRTADWSEETAKQSYSAGGFPPKGIQSLGEGSAEQNMAQRERFDPERYEGENGTVENAADWHVDEKGSDNPQAIYGAEVSAAGVLAAAESGAKRLMEDIRKPHSTGEIGSIEESGAVAAGIAESDMQKRMMADPPGETRRKCVPGREEEAVNKSESGSERGTEDRSKGGQSGPGGKREAEIAVRTGEAGLRRTETPAASEKRREDTKKVSENNRAILPPQMDSMSEDKWQQLWKIYPHTRPFQDEREYLSLRPEDFVILHSASYRLAQNSFLLHGYFNYEHLILTQVPQRNGKLYYIGVPGNFYEKEKQVAVMYGFGSFECRREPAREGDFGYYMIKVEL